MVAARRAGKLAMSSKRSLCRLGMKPVLPDPTANQAPHVVERTRCVFVAAHVEVPKIVSETEEHAQLFKAHVRAIQRTGAGLGVGRFQQAFLNVQGGGLDAITKQEFLAAWEFFDSGSKPQQELIHLLDC